jgi:hypothetical protein
MVGKADTSNGGHGRIKGQSKQLLGIRAGECLRWGRVRESALWEVENPDHPFARLDAGHTAW